MRYTHVSEAHNEASWPRCQIDSGPDKVKASGWPRCQIVSGPDKVKTSRWPVDFVLTSSTFSEAELHVDAVDTLSDCQLAPLTREGLDMATLSDCQRHRRKPRYGYGVFL